MVQDPSPNQIKSKHSKTTREKDLQLDQFTVFQDIRETDLHAKNLETEDILHNTSDLESANPLMGINHQKNIADPQQELSSPDLSPPLLQEKNITHAAPQKTKEPPQQNDETNASSSNATPSSPPSPPSTENNTLPQHIENKNDINTTTSSPQTSHSTLQITSNDTEAPTLNTPIIEQKTLKAESTYHTPENTAPENNIVAHPETPQQFGEENETPPLTALESIPTPEPVTITLPPFIEPEELAQPSSPTEYLNDQISPEENANIDIKIETESNPHLENIDTDHDRGHGNDADKLDEDNPSLFHKISDISAIEPKNKHEKDNKNKHHKKDDKDHAAHDDGKHIDHQQKEKNHHHNNEHDNSREPYKNQFIEHNQDHRRQEFFDFHTREHSANDHGSWLDALEAKDNHTQTHGHTNSHNTDQINWLESIENHQHKTDNHNHHDSDKHHNDTLPDIQIQDDSSCNNNDPTSGTL